jgi:hypothetical protein
VGAHSANFKARQRLSNSPTLLNPLDATFTKNRGVAGSSQLRSCLPSGRAECLPARQSRNGPKYLALVGIVRLMEHLLGRPTATNWTARITAIRVATCATTGKLLGLRKSEEKCCATRSQLRI